MSLMKIGEIEEENVSVSEDAPTEEEKEIDHEFNDSFPIINFAFCMSNRVHARLFRFN